MIQSTTDECSLNKRYVAGDSKSVLAKSCPTFLNRDIDDFDEQHVHLRKPLSANESTQMVSVHISLSVYLHFISRTLGKLAKHEYSFLLGFGFVA